MKLTELVHYFRNGGSYEEFCHSQSLDLESEVIEVYMCSPLDLNNEIVFFEIERTGSKIEYLFKEIKYINLFDFYYFLDTIEEISNNKDEPITDAEIANILLSYARDDA